MTKIDRPTSILSKLWHQLTAKPFVRDFTAERGLWEEWLWAWHAVFYGTLLWIGVCVWALGPPQGSSSTPAGGRHLATLVLSLLLAGWYSGMVLRPANRDRPWMMGLYLAGAMTVWTALHRLEELYLLFSFVIVTQAFALLPVARAILAASLITAVVWLQAGIGLGFAHLSWLLALTVAGLAAGWQKAMVRQSAERQRLLDEIRATRDDLATAERQAGMLEERQRLAREIHDTVAQEFTSIVLHLEAAEAAVSHGAPAEKAPKHLEQALRTARHGLSEARRLVHALRPELLDGSSLPKRCSA